MFKYSASSTQPVVAPEFHGLPELSKEPEEKASDRPDLTLVRTPAASPPRLRTTDTEDDGDLMIPDVLRKPQDAFFGQSAEDDPDRQGEKRAGVLPVAAASAAGLLLLLAGGLVIYAAGYLSNDDAGTVPVKTVFLEGQTSAEPVRQTGAGSSAGLKTQALDSTGFEQRFNSAKSADRHPGTLKIKSQDRVAQIALETAGAAGGAQAPSRPGSRSHLPVLGYASVPNPHAGWDEGQRAISSAAGNEPVKSARIADETPAGGTGDRTEIAAAQPAVTPPAAEPADKAADPGQMADTSTVTADVNLRGTADKDAPVLAVVPSGSSVGVGSCDRWWCAVTFNGQTGFVGKKFVDGKG